MMNEHQIILPPIIGMVSVLALNIIGVVMAFAFARRMKSLRWLPHAFAVALVIASPFLVLALTLPTLPLGEEPGPGDGFIAFPVFLEGIVIISFYVIFCFWLMISKIFNHRFRVRKNT